MKFSFSDDQYEFRDAVRELLTKECSPAHLRDSASIVGEVRVFGRISYLDVWNEERFVQKLQRDPWTDEDGLRLSEHGI